MIDYRNNAQSGINPLTVAAGVVGDRRFWGVGMPGRLAPIQSTQSGSNSYTPCLTQVTEWPWAVDDAGVAFDVGSIWGVRTRGQLDPGGGEIDRWVAVPRTLPAGYTPVGRHGRIVPLIADHLGDDPFQGRVLNEFYGPAAIWPVRWRTPTGQHPPDLMDDGYLWVPMNLNQRTIDASGITGPSFTVADNSGIASGLGGIGFPVVCVVPYTTGPNSWRDWGYNMIGRHVGFRGGKILLSSRTTDPCPPAYAGNVRIVIGWDDTTPATNALPPNIVFDETYTISGMTDIGAGGGYAWRREQTVNLPAMLVPLAEKEPKYWILFFGSCETGDVTILLTSAYLSPRVDIPLWYWASTRNRIAPGGVVL